MGKGFLIVDKILPTFASATQNLDFAQALQHGNDGIEIFGECSVQFGEPVLCRRPDNIEYRLPTTFPCASRTATPPRDSRAGKKTE
jgi:hypothetical protein